MDISLLLFLQDLDKSTGGILRKIAEYTVIHPENLIYDSELRRYNKKYIKERYSK